MGEFGATSIRAAEACAPLPFYAYEFAARSGYPIPLGVIERLRRRAPNLVGLKVSDRPWEKLEPYLLEGLDVFIGGRISSGQYPYALMRGLLLPSQHALRAP